MRFIDEVELLLTAGSGGKGAVSFRREAHVPRGGPDGGKGGRGGSVFLEASSDLTTLLDLRSRRHYKAKHGGKGGTNNKAGRSGEDLCLRVPLGTLVYDVDTGALLADLVESNQQIELAKGGKGGRGNTTFVSSTRKAPDFAKEGGTGDEIRVRLSLKVIADVGLVGLPNAGKSTLITRISAARPKVAEYPFTTLTPNLGVVYSDVLGSFVVADVPGLIEGAHEGAGLGHQFLKHIERTRILVFLLSMESGGDPIGDYRILLRELELFDKDLANRPKMIVASKLDLISHDERESALMSLRALASEEGIPFAACSSVTGEGVQSFRRVLEKAVMAETPSPEYEVYDPTDPNS